MIEKVAPAVGYFLQMDGGYEPEKYPVPKNVQSVLNTKWVGNKLAIGVGGGVGIDAKKLVGSMTAKNSANSKLSNRRQRAPLLDTRTDRWWTD